jgi:hypothetical protein
VPENPYETDDSGSDDSSDGGGGGGGRSTTERGGRRGGGKDPNEPKGLTVDLTLDDPLPPELDPHARGGGDDLGARKVRQARPPGVTQQDVDLVGPAFARPAGPDDEERPATGGTSGTVSQDPLGSAANDVGARRLLRSGGGGEAGSALEALLKRLGLWERWQAGGPDPAK